MIRGRIVRVSLEDASSTEHGRTRTGIVLSNSEQNRVLSGVAVVPLSSRPPFIWPLRVLLPDMDGSGSSFAVVSGLRQVEKGRVVEELGQVPTCFLRDLEEAVSAYLGEA
jgi:mRNA-degrading endonuclease toxin of MazEF toxin-antitoxin module